MRFEWDETKRWSNIAKHGIDFVTVGQVFDGRPCLDRESPRGREQRIVRVAEMEGKIIAVVWVWRGAGLVRIISVRKARDQEEKAYRQLFG